MSNGWLLTVTCSFSPIRAASSPGRVPGPPPTGRFRLAEMGVIGMVAGVQGTQPGSHSHHVCQGECAW